MARFVDTNVLVYAEDRDAGEKRDRSVVLLEDLWAVGDGVLSVQVLQEFFVTVTRKLSRPLPVPAARRIVEEYLTWTVVEGSAALLLDGIRIAGRWKLSLWDSLVIAAAADMGCDILYTEDLNDGQVIEAVRVVDPFV